MGFTLDNNMILYITIFLLVVQYLILKYQTSSMIEKSQQHNNKKIVKKLTQQINATFDQYMGNGRTNIRDKHVTFSQDDTKKQMKGNTNADIDSIEDPANDYNDYNDYNENGGDNNDNDE